MSASSVPAPREAWSRRTFARGAQKCFCSRPEPKSRRTSSVRIAGRAICSSAVFAVRNRAVLSRRRHQLHSLHGFRPDFSRSHSRARRTNAALERGRAALCTAGLSATFAVRNRRGLAAHLLGPRAVLHAHRTNDWRVRRRGSSRAHCETGAESGWALAVDPQRARTLQAW